MRLWLEEHLFDHVWNGSYLTDELRSLVPVLPFSPLWPGSRQVPDGGTWQDGPWSSPGTKLLACWWLHELQMCWLPHRRLESALFTHWSVTKRAEAAASWTPVSQPFTAKTHHTLWKAARTSETEYANGSFKGKDLIKGILVGGYSLAFLKQGCYSFFSSCWQNLCGSGDLNAALTSQHSEEQSVSDIP